MPKISHKDLNRFYPPTRQAWRDWLAQHHASSPGIWLIYYKKHTGAPTVSYDEAVEEALCFGWIDSKPNKLDEDRYMQLFTPRKPKSPWSRLNKTRIEKLAAAGLIAPAGQAKIDAAKENGFWTILDPIENLEVPDDLAEALNAHPPAAEYFDAFAPTYKKGILWWIASAKRPETRAKRVLQTAEMAAKNLKANFDKKSA
ncbi:MAG: YdeI/OmpD-associated family protein [Bacteroidota bacterium]